MASFGISLSCSRTRGQLSLGKQLLHVEHNTELLGER
jgi:hypothetical protein